MLSGDINGNIFILSNLVSHLHGNNKSISCEQSEDISALYYETRPTYPVTYTTIVISTHIKMVINLAGCQSGMSVRKAYGSLTSFVSLHLTVLLFHDKLISGPRCRHTN